MIVQILDDLMQSVHVSDLKNTILELILPARLICSEVGPSGLIIAVIVVIDCPLESSLHVDFTL
jgi:hypothetical protein